MFADITAFAAEMGPLGLSILQIIWIDLILSGDNAVVIALACRSLPDNQRRMGIILGCVVAIVLRIIFAGTITQLLAIPYLKLVGGLLLLWIAVKLLIEDEGGQAPEIRGHDTLLRAVLTVAMADVLMSLDNVIAIAAASKGNVALIAFGIALSIPLIIFGSSLILGLIDRFPIFIWLGSGLLGWISADLIASEPALRPALESAAATLGVTTGILRWAAAAAGVVFTFTVGWLLIQAAERRAARAVTEIGRDRTPAE
ncbi:MAG: TerC family protein [Hyphomicrobiaceae bacterium]